MADTLPTTWPADPHTLAKHAILRRYLQEDPKGHRTIAHFPLAEALLDLGDRAAAEAVLREVSRLHKRGPLVMEARKRLRALRS